MSKMKNSSINGCDQNTTSSAMGSAHPSISILDSSLSPENLSVQYQITKNEATVYEIIFANEQIEQDQTAFVNHGRLNIAYEPPGYAGALFEFNGRSLSQNTWLDFSPEIADLHAAPTQNDVQSLEHLSLAVSQGQVIKLTYSLEDLAQDKTKPSLDLITLLHLLESSGIGRPSTYGAIFSKIIEESGLLRFDPVSGIVELSAEGNQASTALRTYGGEFATSSFASEFADRLGLLANNQLKVPEFLGWILHLLELDEDTVKPIWNNLVEIETSGANTVVTHTQRGSIISGALIDHPKKNESKK